MLKYLLLLLFFSSVLKATETEKPSLGDASAVVDTYNIAFNLEGAKEQDLKLLEVLRDHAVFEKMLHFSATNLQLKSDIVYTFHQGAEPFFGTSQNQVFIPYAFLYQVYEYVQNKYAQQAVLSDKLFALTVEKLLWLELGRTLISQYSLSIIGEEEISLDQFSTIMLLNLNAQDSEYLLDATEEFLQLDDTSTLLSRLSFHNETELDERRYRLVMCTVLGKDYEQHIELLDELAWDQNRLLHCRAHYQEKLWIWYEALKPFLRPENKLKDWVGFIPKPKEGVEASVNFNGKDVSTVKKSRYDNGIQ